LPLPIAEQWAPTAAERALERRLGSSGAYDVTKIMGAAKHDDGTWLFKGVTVWWREWTTCTQPG
jgi:hypothetical protein